MALYNNGYRLGSTPFKRGLGALTTMYNGGGSVFNSSIPTSAMRASYWLYGKQHGYPTGQLHPECWMLPQKAGYMSMRPLGQGSLAAGLIPSYPMSIDLTGSSTFSATGALVVSMLIAMAGEGSLSASILGQLNMEAALSGEGDLSASMEGIASLMIDMLGEGTLDATIAAYGNMDIDIVVTGTGLTTANIGGAVWGALASANNDEGTMGNKLNTASSGGVDLNALADAVWEHNQAVTLNTGVVFLLKMIRNKKTVEKVDNTWMLVVYDDDDATTILSKPLKDANGDDISDLAAGVLAQELAQGT